ncbi:MAG: hypothetical protein A2350_05425 [Candidatus Raymondbacteria bacterium RifOxyB12_full_50_8]|nr:MAG: hypothetical protein A2350_05425 [Candidatus Raymondbacteria bacterium RifOxyB12_full_50_8]
MARDTDVARIARENTAATATPLTILGIDYLHYKTADNGDLYLTRWGQPLYDHLIPQNWFSPEWFEQNREKLQGTSTVYKVKTGAVNNRSIDIVVKWCRVGEQVPLDTLTLNKFINAEFNSPYEEFSLVTEMRTNRTEKIIRTHKPLGIFVPAEKLQLWQTGRTHSRMNQKKAKFRDVELDIYRQYILIYEWIKGITVVEALEKSVADENERKRSIADYMSAAIEDLRATGFRVLDMKPVHIIVRTAQDGSLLRRKDGSRLYAVVDFELLERTEDYGQVITRRRRAEYFKRQKDKHFSVNIKDMPPHLHHMNIFGVDYVYGCTESTQGVVWVVGKDPNLFDFFLPERWRRTNRVKISEASETYYTKTKDNIHLVWKVSKVGEIPALGSMELKGYNSPFEEFAYAIELSHRGVNTIYPRAIYMTGNRSHEAIYINDTTRYENHQKILMADGTPILKADYNYITIWGYWYGPDDVNYLRDEEFGKGMNVRDAFHRGLINEYMYNRLMEQKREKLKRAGFEDLKMKGEHLLLSVTNDNSLIMDKNGLPEVRISNFECMRRL